MMKKPTLIDGCAVFILSYNRAKNMRSHKLFRECHPLYLLLSDDDPQLADYEQFRGIVDDILVYKRDDYPSMYLDNNPDKTTVLPARNAAIELARQLGYKALCMIDDDYSYLYGHSLNVWRSEDYMRAIKLNPNQVVQLVNISFRFILDTPIVDIFAWAQMGDVYGVSFDVLKPRRKAMNTMFMRTDTDIRFLGRFNDDVNTYVYHGNRGRVFLSMNNLLIRQSMTQSLPGGLTEVYRQHGTFPKAASTVMIQPSSVRVGIGYLGRIHHKINYRYTYPNFVNT